MALGSGPRLILATAILAAVHAQRVKFDLHQYILLMTEVRNYYKTSCILFVEPGNYEDMRLMTAMHLVTRKFSHQRVLSSAIDFEDLLQDKIRFGKHVMRPLYIVFLRTEESFNRFVNFTARTDVSYPVWLVVFVPRNGRPMESFCKHPTDNRLNLNFKTEMLVLCYDDPRLHEWYSIGDNRTKTYHLATWVPGKGLQLTTDTSLYARRGNLSGTVLRVATVKVSPFIGVNNGELSGLFGGVMNELSKVMNFKMDILEPVDSYGNWNKEDGTWTGVIGQLVNGQADLGIAEFTVTNHRLNAVDFTIPLILSRNRFYIKRPDGSAVQWSGYFKAFDLGIWVAIVILILTTPILLTFMKARGRLVGSVIADNYVHVWGVYCQQGVSDFPPESSVRLAFLSIFISALIVSSAYSASLISFLTVNTASLPFSTIEGLANDGSYKTIVFRNSADYDVFATATDRIFRKLMSLMKKKSELPLTLKEAFTQVCSQKVAYYTTEAVKNAINIYLPCKIVVIGTGGADSLSFVFSKGNPYGRLMDYHLQRFKDNGMLDRLKGKYLVMANPPESTHEAVGVWGIAPILSIVAGGVILASFILMIERTYEARRRKRGSAGTDSVPVSGGGFGTARKTVKRRGEESLASPKNLTPHTSRELGPAMPKIGYYP